jgi:FAD/FMN-containing dehydrogenase
VNVDQRPAAIALVRSVEDVSAVVIGASRNGLKVMAQSTGHGAIPVLPLSQTVLVRTAGLNEVHVNPAERTVWAGSGAEWQAVTAAAADHGLAVQAGAAADVGIAGFLLSGGISWRLALEGSPSMMCYGSKSSLPMAYRESSTMIMSRMCSGPSAAVAANSAWSPALSFGCMHCLR